MGLFGWLFVWLVCVVWLGAVVCWDNYFVGLGWFSCVFAFIGLSWVFCFGFVLFLVFVVGVWVWGGFGEVVVWFGLVGVVVVGGFVWLVVVDGLVWLVVDW